MSHEATTDDLLAWHALKAPARGQLDLLRGDDATLCPAFAGQGHQGSGCDRPRTVANGCRTDAVGPRTRSPCERASPSRIQQRYTEAVQHTRKDARRPQTDARAGLLGPEPFSGCQSRPRRNSVFSDTSERLSLAFIGYRPRYTTQLRRSRGNRCSRRFPSPL